MYFSHTGHSGDTNPFLFSIPDHLVTFQVRYYILCSGCFISSFSFTDWMLSLSPSLPPSLSLSLSLSPPSVPSLSLWQISADPFRVCKVPAIFVVGSEGQLSSPDYVEVSSLSEWVSEWVREWVVHLSSVMQYHCSIFCFPFMGVNQTIFGIKFLSVSAAPPSQSHSLSITGMGGGWRDIVHLMYAWPAILICMYYNNIIIL